MIYNNMDIAALTRRRHRVREHGAQPRHRLRRSAARDDGAQYGSASRLQAVLNMGPLGQYPADPNALVPARAPAGDTPLTMLAHETGHLFLAYASVADPNDPTATPMLGYQNQHWSFVFNSEASLLEGERIADRGPAASPRFLTTDTVQGYSPLDQYLMGFRAPAEVPDTFVVTGAPAYLQTLASGAGCRVRRRAAEHRDRRGDPGDGPPHARRHRRAAAIPLRVHPRHAAGRRTLGRRPGAGRELPAAIRSFYAKAASNRAVGRHLAAALVAALAVSRRRRRRRAAAGRRPSPCDSARPWTCRSRFRRSNGNAKLPASVTIPAGATTASFTYSGVRAGVEEVTATPGDPAYETAFARVQVGGRGGAANWSQVSPDPVVVRLTDANGLVYPGARIAASASAGGSVAPAVAITDAAGAGGVSRGRRARRRRTNCGSRVEAVPAVSLTLRAGIAVPAIRGGGECRVVSASGIAAGALETIFGANLAGGRVSLNGAPLPLLYAQRRADQFLRARSRRRSGPRR